MMDSFQCCFNFAFNFNLRRYIEEFEPPFNPPAQIDDPTDSKPATWVGRCGLTLSNPC